MFDRGLRQHKKLLFVLMVFLLSLTLACGLTQGFSGNDEAPTPIVDLGQGGAQNDEQDSSATINEPTAEAEEAPPAETEASPTPEDESSPDATPTESSAAEDEPAGQPSGELAENQIFIIPGGEPPTMDPHLSGDATSAEYVVEIYSGLMTYDQDLNLIPDVAESYEVSEDGLVYTFKLREEAVFQDGKQITAEDFKWSFERACDPATQSPTAHTYLGDIIGCQDKLAGEAQEVTGVRVVDDQTLELAIDEPKGFFLAKMSYPTAFVLDREDVEGDSDWATSEPNGSGPFILSDYTPDEGVIILTRNDNYYREPKPVLELVIYLVNAPIQLMTGYEEGFSIGQGEQANFDAIPLSISELSRATDPNNPLSKEFVSTPGLDIQYLGFNVRQPPFDDPNIRQAFNLALDKRRLVRLIFQDTVPVANGIVPPTMPGYENPDLSDFEFDPERALELVAESTYGDVSELPEITLSVSGQGGGVGPVIEAIVESYKTNLGIELAVEQTPWPEFLADLNNPNAPYQMYQLGWIADYPDPQNFLEVLFHSKSSQNHGGYNNPEVDATLDEARKAQDPAEREALYQKAEQMILEDAAWVPLYFGVENWLVKPYVQGFQVPPLKKPKFQYISILEH